MFQRLQTTSHEDKTVKALEGRNEWRLRKNIIRTDHDEPWDLDDMADFVLESNDGTFVEMDTCTPAEIPNSMGVECTFPGCQKKLHTGWMFQQFDQSLLFCRSRFPAFR